MAQPQPIDLSAGLQPKSGGGIDLSAGLEPIGQSAHDIRAGLAGPSWNVKGPGVFDKANNFYNAPAHPGEGIASRLGRSLGRTAMMVPNLVQAAVSGPSEEEKAKGFAPPVLGDQGSLTNLPANALDRVLSLPFKHLAVDPSRQAYQQIQGDVAQAEAQQGHPLSMPQQAVRGAEEGTSMVPLLGPLLLSIARRIDPGTAPGAPPPDIAGGLADALTMHALPEIQREASPGGRLPGAPEASELALPATRAVLGKVAEKFPQAVQTVRGAISPEAMTAEQAATKAFRPRNSKANWQQEVASALPDARRAADALKLDPNAMTLDDALKATSQAKKDVWGEYEHNFKQPNQDIAVDTTSVAGALRKTLSDRQIEQNPNFADRINEIADDYSGRKMSLQDVEDRVRELNNETRGIEAKYLTDKRAAKLDPQNAPLFAERDTLRQLMLDKMDQMSGPGAAQLRKRWGALNSLEDVVSRRIPVAQRQVPNSLPSVLAKAYAAGKVARGVFTLNPADILEGGVSLLSQRKSALLNDPDYLTQLAFRKTVPRSPFVSRFQGDYQVPAGGAPPVPPVVPKQLYGMQLEHMQPVEGEYVQPTAPPIKGLLNRGQYNQPPTSPEDFQFNQPQLPARASAIPLRASTAIEEQPRANVPVPMEPNEPQRPVVQSAGAGNDEQLSGGVSGRVQGGDQPQRTAQSAEPGPGTSEYEALKNRIAVLERARRGSRVQPPPTTQVEAQPQPEPQAQPISKPQPATQPQATAQPSTPDVVEGNREQILQSELKDLKTKREQAMQQLREAPTYGPEATRLRERHNELLRQIQQRDDELARLKGEPTRSEKRAMQEQQAEKAFADRPEQAMKYGQPEQSQHWQVKEPDYIEKRFQQKIADYERAIPQQQVEVAKTSSTSQKGIQAKASLKYWEDLLEAYKNRDPRKAQQFKTEYNDLVKKSVSQGKPVPQEVIDQKPEFELAQTARERYEKGRHTSFANRSAAINDTMQKEEGFKVKRQDGKAITDDQIKEISGGVNDIASVVGDDLRNMMRDTDLTISHTNGKHPFLSDAGGQYHPADKSISSGVNNFLGQPIRALAHELAHWMDYEAGRALGKKATIFTKSGVKRSQGAFYLSESENREPGDNLIGLARRTMSDSYEASKMIKTTKLSDLPEGERAEVERMKVVLGHYWKDPREIWARLFEQYIATKLGRQNLAAESPQKYQKTPAYWSAQDWRKLEPMVQQAIQKRMDALRGGETEPSVEAAPNVATKPQTSSGESGEVPKPVPQSAQTGAYGSQTQVLTSGQNLPGKSTQMGESETEAEGPHPRLQKDWERANAYKPPEGGQLVVRPVPSSFWKPDKPSYSLQNIREGTRGGTATGNWDEIIARADKENLRMGQYETERQARDTARTAPGTDEYEKLRTRIAELEAKANPSEDQQAFRDGVTLENGRVGKEAHDYGRVVSGVANLLKEKGIKPSSNKEYWKQSGSPMYWELSDLFHSPLASMNPKMAVENIARAMDGQLPTVGKKIDENGWQFKQAFDMGGAAKSMEESLSPAGRFGRELESAEKGAERMRRSAEIVQALLGETENVKKARAAADQIEQRVDSLRESARGRINEAKESEQAADKAAQERPVALAKQLQPIENAKWTPSSAWIGNRVKTGENTPWVSDGHSAINLDFAARKPYSLTGERAFAKANVGKLKEPDSANPGIVTTDMVNKVVERSTAKSVTDGRILGFLPEDVLGEKAKRGRLGGTPKAYIENTKSRQVIPVDARILKMIQDAVQPDSIKVGTQHDAIAFYKGDKLAAVAMPLRTDVEIDVPTAREIAKQKGGK